MLHFNRLFNIRDVYLKIPPEQLKEPETEVTLDEAACRLAIVGEERDGSILVARDGYDQVSGTKRTYIDLYDTNTRELRTLYKHDKIVDCVGCSVNEQRTLFAFTILTNERKAGEAPSPVGERRKDSNTESEKEDVFQSYIVEIHENGKRYELNIRNTIVQRVQFVHGMSKSRKSYVLFMLDKEFIHLYQIATHPKRDMGVKIVSQPMLFFLIVKKYLWAEWDNRRSCLHVLCRANNAKDPSDCVLRCHFFTESESKMLYELPLNVKLPSFISEFDRNHNPFFGYDRRAVAASSNYLQVVHMRGNGVCFCQQHIPYPNQPTTDIHVTIYVLHQRTKLDFDIPLNNFDPAVAAQTRVYFDSIADMLLLYIPGHHFQLIDCGSEHEPCLSITRSGSESAPFLPNTTSLTEAPVIVPFGVFTSPFPTQMNLVSDLRGKTLLDSRTGIAYEFTLAREALLDIFDLPPSELQLQALHLAITHMNDTELVDQIMTRLCQDYPHNVTTGLLKEFLIGGPYMELKHTHNMEQRLLDVLPITCIETLRDAAQYKNRNLNVTCTMLNGYYVLPHLSKLCIKKENPPKDKIRRFSFEALAASATTEKLAIPFKSPTSPMRKFFSGWMFEEGTPEPISNDDEEECAYNGPITRAQIVDALAAHINNCYPKDTIQKCKFWAKNHQIEQEKKVNRLFKYIHQKRQHGEDESRSAMTEFQLLEMLYASIEEIAYPFPKGFPSHFVSLALKCLSRSVFLQYLNRGLFRLTEGFVEDVLEGLTESPADRQFKYQLLCKLKESSSITLMQKRNENVDYVLSHLVTAIPVVTGDFLTGGTDPEASDRSSFLPLTIYLEALGRNQTHASRKDVVHYIADKATQSIQDTFEVNRFLPPDHNNNNNLNGVVKSNSPTSSAPIK